MENFIFQNPVKIIFGKGTISRLNKEIAPYQKIIFLYGQGSIKKNGIYQQVITALQGTNYLEFAGIETNPHHQTCLKAIEICRKERIDFILAVGGGSVIDAAKYIATGALYDGNPWEIVQHRLRATKALPIGSILTLPATGSEMNSNFVISNIETDEKFASSGPATYPRFSIIDPETCYSLDNRQIANGIADAFVHVAEQYMTYPTHAPLQDRQAEAIFQTLIYETPTLLENRQNYHAWSTLIWCATNALNNLIACGVPQDWSTHQIGHELTALYGLDHAQSLAVVLPRLWEYQKDKKREKLLQFGARVLNQENETVEQVIDKIERFFISLGMKTRLYQYGIEATEAAEKIKIRMEKRKSKLGEHGDLGPQEIAQIISKC